MSCTDCVDICDTVLESMCFQCNKCKECHGPMDEEYVNHEQMIECLAELLATVEHIIHIRK